VTRATTLAAPRRRMETTAAVTVGAAVLALYLPVLRDLVGVWLQVPYYSYGFLVPLFSTYLIWDVLKADAAHDEATPTEPSGFVMMAAGLATLGVGVAAGSLTLRAVSLPAVLMGLALATLGASTARRLAFPLGFLLFMAPLPDGVLPTLSLPLQQLAAVVSEWTLRRLGVPVTRDDLFLTLPSVTLHVTEACNGLRFLFAMIVIATAFAGTTQRRLHRGAVLVVAASVLAVVANLARVTGTGVMAELWGARAAIGLPHLVWGKIVYGLTLVPFVALVLWMRRR
jgi:exosortase